MAARALRAPLQLLAALVRPQQQRGFHASGPSGSLYFEELHAAPTAAAAAAPTAPSARRPCTIVALHGLLGSGRNLRSVMSSLCRAAADASGTPFRTLLVDLRCHGHSASVGSLHPPHTLAAAAADVVSLCRHQLAAPSIWVGHSLGGKVVLEALTRLGAPAGEHPAPAQMWCLDTRPSAVLHADKATQDVQQVLAAVSEVPQPLPSRQALYDILASRGLSRDVQTWLGSSLVQAPGRSGLHFQFNAAGCQQLFDDYCRRDYSQLLRAPPRGVQLHVLRALRSDRWDPETLGIVRSAAATRGQTFFHELPDAGHWLHTENPKGLVQLMLPWLVRAAAA